MQKLTSLLTLVCVALMAACTPQPENADLGDAISVSEIEVTATADASIVNLAVAASSDDWTVESDSEWCVAVKVDKTLTLELAENTSSERVAVVTLTCGEASTTLTIIQADGTIEDAISVVDITLTMPASASSLFLPVSATGQWYPESDMDWCKAKVKDNGVMISLEGNAGAERTATVTLYCGEASAVVTLTQQRGATINVSPSELTFLAEGGTLKLGVTTENISDWSASSADKWLTVKTNGGIITVEATANNAANAREGVVAIEYIDPVTGEPATIEVVVSQGTALEASVEALNFEATQTEATITISSIGAWTLAPTYAGATWVEGITADWVSVSTTEGEAGQTEITVTVEPSYTARTAQLMITCGKMVRRVAINQAAMPAPMAGRKVRVMSWNQNVKANEGISNVIKELDIDFVALQEVDVKTGRSGGKDQMADLKRLTGYEGSYFCKTINYDGGDYGIGILSKKAALQTRFVDLPGGENRKLFIAEYDDFVFASTHFSYDVESQMRIDHLASAKIAVEEFAKYTDKPVVLGGDFNTETDIDKRQTHGHLMTVMDMIIDPSIMTWPGTLPASKQYLLDFLFIKSHVPYAWTNGGWVNKTVSDHCPVWAEVVLFE